MIPQKKIVRADVNQQKHTQRNSKLIRNHVSIMTAATVIIISLITNIKIAIILIAITKNDYHDNNNSNNNNNNSDDNNKSTNNNNNNIIIIITDRYAKLTRSSYRYCFPHCSFFEKNAF